MAWRGRITPARGALVCDGAATPAPCGCASPEAHALCARLSEDLTRRMLLGGGMAAAVAAFAPASAQPASAQPASAQPAASAPRLLLANLRLFDGVTRRLREGVNILIEGERIIALPGAGEAVEGALVRDCGGRLAMPGLIDAHWHSMLCAIPQLAAMTAELAFVHIVAAREAERTLLRGFTTIRDAGGPAFALKRAIDLGLIPGPRIYPSGAMISQTSGHGDFRLRQEVPRAANAPLSQAELGGIGAIADGEAEVLRRVREQLLLGASQIKITGGGGVSSAYDPIDTLQFRESEQRAAVEAAADWGTYVMSHVYTPAGIRRALRAGVRSIEHGQLCDEETARMMAGEGVWWSLQPFLADEDANPKSDPASAAKQREVAEGTLRAFEFAQRFRVNMAWGTDILFSPESVANHGRQLAKLTRFFDPLELLAIATGRNGALCALSGARNPYPGPIGVIAPGAMADILIAEGEPARSLDFLMDPARNLKLILKGGRIHKDGL
ncbi:metal-dependent hydrolase family protein [Rubritepida flocculans]|uniref:metal-dependent hydrolase family protein n=1 Tax=Rubritepida flocculans TaxID=182403 RepID=UPI00041E489E|nr:amidohydrolase family protein [Rubritepida flocculans]